MADQTNKPKKSNKQTQKENALGTTQESGQNKPAVDKGYSGSDDNQGGNYLDRQGTEGQE
jgi:hypothetical protein